MKFNKLFMGFLGALALTACSSEQNIPDVPNGSGNEDSRFMSITIRNTGMGGTRAAGDQAGNLYEEGLTGENKVNNIRFYFFGENGEPFKLSSGTNYYECSGDNIKPGDNTPEDPNPDMPNIEQKLQAIIVLTTDNADSFSNLKSMVAVTNYEKAGLGDGSASLADLQGITGNYGLKIGIAETVDGRYIHKKFNNKSENIPTMLMTSSVYGTDEQYEGCEVFIDKSKLKTSREEAIGDPVDVFVERVVAKVRMTTNWTNVTPVKMTYSVDGKEYWAVPLSEKTGANSSAEIEINGNQIYALFFGWGLQSFTDNSYLFKNFEGWKNWELGTAWVWNDPNYHRSYWALNSPDAKINHAWHTDANAKIGTKLSETVDGVTTTINYDGDFFYTQENAGNMANGQKSDYDPDLTVSNRTQAYVSAVLVDATGKPVDLAEWGGQRYLTEDVAKAMFAAMQKQVLLRKLVGKETVTNTDGTTSTVFKYNYVTIPEEYVGKLIHLVPAEDVPGKTDTKSEDGPSENSKRYLSYIQLVDNAQAVINEIVDFLNNKEGLTGENRYEAQIYNADHTPIDLVTVNSNLASMPGAKVWQAGKTYYYTDLRHLNPESKEITQGYYGVVRNHIYEVELNTIYGLGTPVLYPDGGEDKEIIPQKPTPDAFFLGARINILSWRVVSNKVDFEW